MKKSEVTESKRVSFMMKKIHVDKKNVIITYNLSGSDKTMTVTGKDSPHPDMHIALRVFRPLMVEMFEQHNSEGVEYSINGITLSSLKGKEQVLISTTYTLKSGQKVCINSPNVRLEGDDWENQKEIELQVQKVEDEAFEYLFNNKQAQLSIEDNMEEEEVEEKE
jgi:hypothetical protein